MVNPNKIFKLLIIITFGLLLLFVQGCSKSSEAEVKNDNSEQLTFNNLKSIPKQLQEGIHYKYFLVMLGKDSKWNTEEKYGDTCSSCHSSDSTIDVSCQLCHSFGGTQMVTLNTSGSETCMKCHTNGEPPVLGQRVNLPQAEMVKGIGVGEVEDMPSWKYENMKDTFACYDCHLTNNMKHDFLVPGGTVTYDETGTLTPEAVMDYNEFRKLLNQDKCTTCHYDPEETINNIEQQQKEISEKLNFLKTVYDEWNKKVYSLNLNDPRVKIFNEGATYYSYVAADGSKGVHNYELSRALLDQAMAKFSELK